jgi:hypothetical protein
LLARITSDLEVERESQTRDHVRGAISVREVGPFLVARSTWDPRFLRRVCVDYPGDAIETLAAVLRSGREASIIP